MDNKKRHVRENNLQDGDEGAISNKHTRESGKAHGENIPSRNAGGLSPQNNNEGATSTEQPREGDNKSDANYPSRHACRLSLPQELRGFFNKYKKIALAFSGGVDSSYLLYAAGECGATVRAYYVKTQFQPAFELEDARRVAKECGADMRILEMDALADTRVAENPQDRCYYCKNNIFGGIICAAREDGFEHIMDGTNASDEADDRPGMRALSEMGVLSPLRMCGVTKAAVREYSRGAGLFTWDKPAYACLATRVPSGRRITAELLVRVEGAEAALFALGFTDFRVRVSECGARLELVAAQFVRAAQLRGEIHAALSPFFGEVTLDMRARGE